MVYILPALISFTRSTPYCAKDTQIVTDYSITGFMLSVIKPVADYRSRVIVARVI